MTPAQLITLKADIQGNTDPTVINALAAGDMGAIAAWYNLDASPDYFILKNEVTSDEIRDLINAKNIADITDADRGRCVDLLAIRADRGFSGANSFDRAAWDDIFSAATGDESQQAIAAYWNRLATNGEKVFATNTGGAGTSDGSSAANADITSFQGNLSHQDISAALAS